MSGKSVSGIEYKRLLFYWRYTLRFRGVVLYCTCAGGAVEVPGQDTITGIPCPCHALVHVSGGSEWSTFKAISTPRTSSLGTTPAHHVFARIPLEEHTRNSLRPRIDPPVKAATAGWQRYIDSDVVVWSLLPQSEKCHFHARGIISLD
jgi:hypothetical protein